MLAVIVKFELKDEVREMLTDTEIARKHIDTLVEGCQKIHGLKEKFFIIDPGTFVQGAMLIWETQEHFDAYLKSNESKVAVLDTDNDETPIKILSSHSQAVR